MALFAKDKGQEKELFLSSTILIAICYSFDESLSNALTKQFIIPKKKRFESIITETVKDLTIYYFNNKGIFLF